MIYQLDDTAPQLDSDDVFVAENAAVIGNIRLRTSSSVWFGATLRGDNELIDIGQRSNVQDGAVLHTDPGCPLVIEEDVTIGHNVTLHGCQIGPRVIIGMGSIVLNRAKIGSDSIVGAGALITEGKEFPEGSLIVGSPARVARPLNDQEKMMLKGSAGIYVQNAKRFKAGLKAV